MKKEVNLNALKMTMRAYQKVSKSVLDDFVKRDELGELAWQNDTPVGTTDSYVRKRGAWVKGVSQEELDETLKGYVEEIPAGQYSADKQYARRKVDAETPGEWVEVEATYKRPAIVKCEFIDVAAEYDVGTTVTINKIRHQETNIVHVYEGKMKVYLMKDTDTDFNLIGYVPASETEIIAEMTPYSFVLGTSAILKFEMETDVGNFYYETYVITGKRTTMLYTGTNQKTVLTAADFNDLTLKEYSTSTFYSYNLTTEDYIWWCTNFELEDILQDGLYHIDYIQQDGKVTFDGVEYYCYRTLDRLTTGRWKFKLEGDPTPKPPEPVLIGDLRLGGSMEEVMTAEEIANLTAYDFSEDKVYSVRISTECYIWACSPYDMEVENESGVALDFTERETVTYDGKTFKCQRSNEKLVVGKWKFKFMKL